MHQLFNGDCINKGPDFYGIKLDPGYFETAKNRVEEAEF